MEKERILLELSSCTKLEPIYLNDSEIITGLQASTVLIGDNTYNGVYFPAEEIEASYMTWDKQPININHSKDISDEVGFITEPIYDVVTKTFKLTPMLNPITNKYDIVNGFIQNRFDAGKPPEVSVGAWIDKVYELSENGEDRLTARNIIGDHLAIVYRGACSPEAGCGIGLNVNKIGNKEDEKLERLLLLEKIKSLKLNLEV